MMIHWSIFDKAYILKSKHFLWKQILNSSISRYWVIWISHRSLYSLGKKQIYFYSNEQNLKAHVRFLTKEYRFEAPAKSVIKWCLILQFFLL